MSTAFLTQRDALVALLLAPPALAGGFVKPGRAHSLPAEQNEGIFVRLVNAPGTQPFAGDTRTDWQTTLLVTCVARAAPDVDGETAVDPLLQATFERLSAASPEPSADAWTVQPSVAWDTEEAEQTLGAASLRVQVRHRTGTGTLTPAT